MNLNPFLSKPKPYAFGMLSQNKSVESRKMTPPEDRMSWEKDRNILFPKTTPFEEMNEISIYAP
jgi:hypothetical protein